jgi:hypothetical protein
LIAAKTFGINVISGHTGRMGLLSYIAGCGGSDAETVAGMENGHPMDIRLAHGLNSLTRGWHLGFGVLTIDRTRVKPEVFPISGGRLVTD